MARQVGAVSRARGTGLSPDHISLDEAAVSIEASQAAPAARDALSVGQPAGQTAAGRPEQAPGREGAYLTGRPAAATALGHRPPGTVRRCGPSGRGVQSDMTWHHPDPVAGLARRVIEELDGIDLSRLRQCQRKERDLLFFDTARSRSQRWHAENPCGWLERQRRRRAT
jgi:hypothetical protein